jgi:hypothetical protein
LLQQALEQRDRRRVAVAKDCDDYWFRLLKDAREALKGETEQQLAQLRSVFAESFEFLLAVFKFYVCCEDSRSRLELVTVNFSEFWQLLKDCQLVHPEPLHPPPG